MKKKAVFGMMLALMLMGMLTLAFNIRPVRAESRTWYVDDDGGADFTKIQDAIDAANPGDIVFVYSGTYYERLTVDKNDLELIGENRETTIIDGGSQDFTTVVKIAGNSTVLRGFTIRVIGMDSQHILVSETVDTVIADNNITGRDYGIRVNASTNITLSGNSITGCSWSIILFNSANASITENIMEKRSYRHSGILLYNSFNNVVAGNNMTEMAGFCIDLRGSSNNTIVDNKMTGAWNDISKWYDGGGIRMQASSIEKCSTYNIFSDNDIRNISHAVATFVYGGIEGHHDNVFLRNNITNSAGIYLMNSYDFTFKENTFSENHYNIGIYGDDLSHYIHDMDTSNTVNGKPVYYLVNQQNLRIDPSSFPDIGYLALVNSTNISVENLNLEEKDRQGLLMAHTSNSTIINNNIRNYSIGISLDVLSSSNTVSGNNLSENIDGVLLEYSFNNSFTYNTASNNRRGFYLKGSWNNTLAYNVIENNTRGGVWLDYSTSNTIVCNHIANNQATEISDAGVSLYRSYINRIFHNNFINNERQAYTPLGNFWDDGYPSGGNYWSDHTTVDEYSGVNQDELGSDGLVDEPYYIDSYNRDNYPLVEPWTPLPRTTGELKAKIEKYWADGEIDNQGIVRGLIAKLNVAQKLIDKEKTDEAIMVLEDFIIQVQELSGIHITAEAADILIQSAEHIVFNL